MVNTILHRNYPSIRKLSCVKKIAKSGLKIAITNAKVDFEKCNGRNNFGLWK